MADRLEEDETGPFAKGMPVNGMGPRSTASAAQSQCQKSAEPPVYEEHARTTACAEPDFEKQLDADEAVLEAAVADVC